VYPDLFVLPLPGPDFQVSTYRAAYALATLVTILLAWLVAVRSGMPRGRALAVIVACALALPAGARLLHAALNWSLYAEEPARIWSLEATGHAMFGGVLAVAIVGFGLARALGLDPWRLADAGAIALAVGVATMRIGCFSQGCCHGLPADRAWAVTFPSGSPSHLWQIGHGVVGLFEGPVAVHPTQFYELIGVLVAGAIVAGLFARGVAPGVPFLAFVGLYAVVRWGNVFFRVAALDSRTIEFYRYFYPLTLLVCLVLIVWRLRASARAQAGNELARTPA
jgi:phosphatidylglycerol:prolipoprotein diacylglycerol transferase